MRITQEQLLKLARDHAEQRSLSDRSLLGIYLQGSLLQESALLGGTADIDLFLVHSDVPAQEREIVRISDEVHLDIAHHSRSQYRQTRELRRHPWMGFCINGGKILYDPQHFLDFTLASVRGQFENPDHVLARAGSLLDHGRQMWQDFQRVAPSGPGPAELSKYLLVIDHAANAVAALSGPPLTERRFLQHFPARAAAIHHPGLAAGLSGLLGGPQADQQLLRGWLTAWEAGYRALEGGQVPVRLHPNRFLYYRRGMEALLESTQPVEALWPLLRTWTLMAGCFTPPSPHIQAWQVAGEHLGLLGPAFAGRVEALDAFLDTVEELLDDWGRQHGA